MEQHIIIIAEHDNGKIAPITFELIECAKILQQFTAASIKIFISGHNLSATAHHLAEESGIDIIVITSSNPKEPDETIFKDLPLNLLTDLNPLYICIAQNQKGLDFAPGLAIRLNAACITGVEKIIQRDDGLCFSRSLFNDKITADITSTAGTTILTIQPGIFKPKITNNSRPGTVSTITLPACPQKYHFKRYKKNQSDTSGIVDADVIVSAGNGIGKKENLDLIRRLARLFPKSHVGGSRPVCDKKWLPYNQQIGITGATVRPKLYIACGISGSSQHIAGMRDSKFIVAINKDPHSAIFNFADICIVEDAATFIPLFIDTYQENRFMN